MTKLDLLFFCLLLSGCSNLKDVPHGCIPRSDMYCPGSGVCFSYFEFC